MAAMNDQDDGYAVKAGSELEIACGALHFTRCGAAEQQETGVDWTRRNASRENCRRSETVVAGI